MTGFELGKLSVSSLGSGSKGNACLVKYADCLLLVDSGFSARQLETRLTGRGVNPQDISAVLVTHEHSDHFGGVPNFANKYQLPVWMSAGTAFHPKADKIQQLNRFNTHQSFYLGKIQVTPVIVPHDAREACQFIFSVADKKIGLLTDLGHVTPFVIEQYKGCDILLLEFNHDHAMLMAGSYAPPLKARIAGGLGHLSNTQAIEFLRETASEKLQFLVAMHLSEENNRVDLVEKLLAGCGLGDKTRYFIASQPLGFDWLMV